MEQEKQNFKSGIVRALAALLLCGSIVCGVGFGGWVMEHEPAMVLSAAKSGSECAMVSIAAGETVTEDGGNGGGCAMVSTAAGEGEGRNRAAYVEQFKPYERFGLTYDVSKNGLRYQGKLVRWFEDSYEVADDGQGGIDYFDGRGVVDVHAVRDFSSIIRSDDGSFDPSGKLIGLKEFSKEEFAVRDVEAIQNPAPVAAVAGDLPSAKELEDMAKEYEGFGLTYDVKGEQWYFKGEKVRYFLDVLFSEGEELTAGRFQGTIRTSWKEGGTVDIYTVRDFAHLNASGDGTLTGVEKYSQKEFDGRVNAVLTEF